MNTGRSGKMIKKIFNATKDDLIVTLERKHNIQFKKNTVKLSPKGLTGEIK